MDSTDETTYDTEHIRQLFDNVLSKEINPDAINGDQIVQEVALKKSSLRKSRTASLSLEYMDMIDILRRFIKAERTGNWGLHLKAMQDMLPFFAAAGHNLYLKSR